MFNGMKWIKDFMALVSRVMKLEERVSSLEKKLELIQAPAPDVKQ
jgi:hypothetical protein